MEYKRMPHSTLKRSLLGMVDMQIDFQQLENMCQGDTVDRILVYVEQQ